MTWSHQYHCGVIKMIKHKSTETQHQISDEQYRVSLFKSSYLNGDFSTFDHKKNLYHFEQHVTNVHQPISCIITGIGPGWEI